MVFAFSVEKGRQTVEAANEFALCVDIVPQYFPVQISRTVGAAVFENKNTNTTRLTSRSHQKKSCGAQRSARCKSERQMNHVSPHRNRSSAIDLQHSASWSEANTGQPKAIQCLSGDLPQATSPDEQMREFLCKRCGFKANHLQPTPRDEQLFVTYSANARMFSNMSQLPQENSMWRDLLRMKSKNKIFSPDTDECANQSIEQGTKNPAKRRRINSDQSCCTACANSG